MKFAAVIIGFLAVFSQSFSQTGKTIWTKGGHTGLVSNLYFDTNGNLLSAGSILFDAVGENYNAYGNEAFAFGWEYNNSNIIESYYGFEPYFIPWNNYSQTYTRIKSRAASFSKSYVAGLFTISTLYTESHFHSETDTSHIIIINRETNKHLDSIALADTNVSISLHPFRTQIAYSSWKKGVIVKDFVTKQAVTTLKTPNPLALSYSPDGNSLAVATRDSGVSVYNSQTGELSKYYLHENPVYLLQFFKDTPYIIAIDSVGSIILWNVETDTKLVVPSSHKALITGIATIGNDYTLSSLDSTLSFWNLSSANYRTELRFKNGVTSIALKNVDGTLAVGLDNGDIKITGYFGENRRNLSLYKGNANSVSVSADETSIVVKSNDVERRKNYFHYFDKDGILIRNILFNRHYINPKESPTHKKIATFDFDLAENAVLALKSFPDTNEIRVLKTNLQINPTVEVYSTEFTFTPDSRILASRYGADSVINFWDVETGLLKKQFPNRTGRYSLRFSPDGTLFITSHDSAGRKQSAIWRSDDFSLVKIISAPAVNGLISPNNQFAALFGQNVVLLWDIQNNVLVDSIITGSKSKITDYKFSPNSQYLTIAQKQIYIWDIAAKRISAVLENQKAPESSFYIDFSSDGRYLVSAGKSVRLWDLNGITSVDEEKPVLKTDGLLKVFPNPSNGILTLQHDGFKNISGGEIRIFNSLGMLLKTFPAEFLKEMKVDCSELSGGVCFVELSSEKGVVSRTSFNIAK